MNSGSLIVDAGAPTTVVPPYTATGSITDNGYIQFGNSYTGTTGISGTGSVFFSGVVSTGAGSTASLNFGGSVTISGGFLARLAGRARGTQYDAMIVQGGPGATLSTQGTLQVVLSGGFAPAAGDNFDLFDWAQHDGVFDAVTLPPLGAGLAWSTLNLYSNGANGGTISVVDANLIPGDVNHDARVDVADISAMAGALHDLSGYQNGRGLTTSQLQLVGDLNGDGHVDNRDMQALENYLALFASTGITSISAVPEPPSVVLTGIGIIVLLGVSRCQRTFPIACLQRRGAARR
jgi:hypothetical protein